MCSFKPAVSDGQPNIGLEGDTDQKHRLNNLMWKG